MPLPVEPWESKRVVADIVACRMDRGIPLYKTRFGGQSLGGVMYICWAGFDKVESKMYSDVPREMVDFLEEDTGDWKRLIAEFGTGKEIKQSLKEPVFIKPPSGREIQFHRALKEAMKR